MPGVYDPRVTPWAIQEAAFSASAAPAEQMRFLLGFAILAPSGHNTQPWKFRVDDTANALVAYADYDRRLPVVDPDNRELLMSVGAAVCNYRVAAAHFGLTSAAVALPARESPVRGGAACEAVSTVSLNAGQPDESLAALLPAIKRRRTNRSPYEARPLSASDREALLSLPAPPGTGVLLIEEAGLKACLAELVAEGDRRQMSNPAFRNELAGWVRPNSAGHGDGVAGDGFGIPDLMSWSGSWFIRSLDLGVYQSRRSRRLAREAAALAVVYGLDTIEALLATGEYLERILLTAAARKIQYAFLNQPLEVADLRDKVRTELGVGPQIILRLGYGPDLFRAMPRRPLEQVLL